MKLIDSAFRLFLCTVVLLTQAILANAQNVNRVEKNLKISIDFQSAQAIISLLEQKLASDADLSRVARLPGNQRLIRKVAGYNRVVTPETFTRTLRQTIENQNFSEDPFEWQTVKQKLPEIKSLIERIENNQTALFAELQLLIEPYTPKDLTADIEATFLIGGGALGFTIDGSDGFHAALHKVGGDYEGLKYLVAHELYHLDGGAQVGRGCVGLKYLVAHELYHSIQALGAKRRRAGLTLGKPPENVRNSLIIIENTYTEGTATLVGDSLNAKNLKPFGQSQQDEYKKNLARSRQNFALFEALLFQANNDPNADIEQLYNIGFSTEFDETLYYVGYKMARSIEKYKGKPALAALVVKHPIEFFNAYIEIYKTNNDPALIKFSKSTEDILLKLQEWKDKT